MAIWLWAGGYFLVLSFNSFGSSGEYGALSGEQVKLRLICTFVAAVFVTFFLWAVRPRKA